MNILKKIKKRLKRSFLFKTLKNHKTQRAFKHLNYKTFNDLAFDIKNNISKIPTDIDLIVGIPRSGIIPAYTIALALNKKVCSLPEFLNESFLDNNGYGFRKIDQNSNNIKNILIVDDSVMSGRAISQAKEQTKALREKYNITYMAVYSTNNKSASNIDLYLEEIPSPRFFQWNYMYHGHTKHAAYDMDGVLCLDPTNEENDDGEKYIEFIKNAKPLYIPNNKIAYIVTSRLEKYRKETQEWLTKHNIEYGELYMYKGTAEERRRLGLHANFKADIYKKLKDCVLFIESNDNQAKKIEKLSGKRVICCSTDNMYYKS